MRRNGVEVYISYVCIWVLGGQPIFSSGADMGSGGGWCRGHIGSGIGGGNNNRGGQSPSLQQPDSLPDSQPPPGAMHNLGTGQAVQEDSTLVKSAAVRPPLSMILPTPSLLSVSPLCWVRLTLILTTLIWMATNFCTATPGRPLNLDLILLWKQLRMWGEPSIQCLHCLLMLAIKNWSKLLVKTHVI